jgi:2-hydroxychromene-2-carboxylate isomerase
MHNRTRVIAAAAAVSAALAAGGTAAAVASTGAKPGAHATTVSATKKPGAPSGTQGQDALVAALARELNVSTAQVSAALQPLFAAGQADTSSPVFAAAARSLGVSTQQLATALADAKQSLAGGTDTTKNPGGSKTAPSGQGQDALVAAVARELNVSTAQVSAALQPLFAAGQADTSSPVFATAARSLGVSTQQLATALAGAKQSLAGGS